MRDEDNDRLGYRGNKNLRRSGVEQQWTKEQLIEWKKCYDDPAYFIKTYVKIVHIDHGVVPFNLWDFQEKLVDDLHNNRFVIGLWGRQMGKCLEFSERINIRNKKTKEIVSITIGEFYEMAKKQAEKN